MTAYKTYVTKGPIKTIWIKHIIYLDIKLRFSYHIDIDKNQLTLLWWPKKRNLTLLIFVHFKRSADGLLFIITCCFKKQIKYILWYNLSKII